MKTLSYALMGIGFIIFGIAGSCDVLENPIMAVPVLAGLVLMVVGAFIRGRWSFEDEADYWCDDYHNDDSDDGIVYISCECDRDKRYVD